jgi:Ala-tRNA(Pro) deacylase
VGRIQRFGYKVVVEQQTQRRTAMPVARLKELLDREGVKYVCQTHSPAYTAQEIAASAHISGGELAKTVMVKIDGNLAMAVLPASFMVDLDRLRQATGAKKIELAGEEEFERLFPGCELGAMPPFGNLFDMEVFVDKSLSTQAEIAFNAGSHVELIRLGYPDFERLVDPELVEFSVVASVPA